MKNKILFSLGFLTQLLSLSVFSQQKPLAATDKQTEEKSLLWKISGNGLKKPSYVFGTIHAICAGDYFFTDKMNKAAT